MSGNTPLPETLADDQRLASQFEEYLVCKVYLDQLEHERKPETSTLRSIVGTRLKSISRELRSSASTAYPGLDDVTIAQAADIILGRQPVGKAHYLAMLPAQ